MSNFYKNEKLPSKVILEDGVIKFKDNRSFVTCYSPLRMIELGIFGHGYFGIKDVDDSEFRKILNLIPNFAEQIDDGIREKILLSPQNFSLNRYGTNAGLDHTAWLENKWIISDDPYGWFNWYIQFYYGRRHRDDFRQINRFRSFVKRHRGMLAGFCQKANVPIEQAEFKYQKTCQGLLQWAWDHTVDPVGKF
jgi:hypothetical protein